MGDCGWREQFDNQSKVQLDFPRLLFFAPRLSHTLKHTVHTIALWAKVKTCDSGFFWFVQALSQGQDECDPVKKGFKMGIIELAIQEITTFSLKNPNS